MGNGNVENERGEKERKKIIIAAAAAAQSSALLGTLFPHLRERRHGHRRRFWVGRPKEMCDGRHGPMSKQEPFISALTFPRRLCNNNAFAPLFPTKQ